MAYTPTYTDADVSPAAVDGIVKVIAVFGSLGTIIGLFLIYLLWKRNS
jgi:hypothetical protein